jgi:hypothetical protein
LPRQIGALRSLIGTPLGLNIRNVAWHGFLGEADFYPGYVSLTLAIALALAPPDDSSARPRQTAISRPLLAIAPLVESTWREESGGCVLLAERSPSDPQSERKDDGDEDVSVLGAVRRLVRRSGFIVPHSRFLMESAIDALEQKHERPDEIDCRYYYQCLVSALPALEHCLRRLYVSINALPPAMLTAGSYLSRFFCTTRRYGIALTPLLSHTSMTATVMYDYYTTLDVIVAPTVEINGQPNLLRTVLSSSAPNTVRIRA